MPERHSQDTVMRHETLRNMITRDRAKTRHTIVKSETRPRHEKSCLETVSRYDFSCLGLVSLSTLVCLVLALSQDTWVIYKVCKDNKLAYLVHRSIIFDSCVILGMLIKGRYLPITTPTAPKINRHTRRPTVHVRPRVRAYSAGGNARDISTAGRIDRD